MTKDYFRSIESLSDQTAFPLSDVISELAFNQDGLIPVITQDSETDTVLMFAWMNKEALIHTLETGNVTYWSRSRKQLWLKGETSGHTQSLVGLSFDCDGDCILCRVKQSGPACHTGRPNCFYLAVNRNKHEVVIHGDPA